jgi:hypothetical protein
MEKLKNNSFERVEKNRKILSMVMDMLCPISLSTMLKFQQEHISDRSSNGFENFVKEQNKRLLECLEIELSTFGTDIREQLGLIRLTKETEIEVQGVSNEN